MAFVRVINNQTIDHETEVIEESGEGSLTEKNGKQYIQYKVKTQDGISSVTVIAEDGKVRIKRVGVYSSVMYYDTGRKTAFLYRTPYGDMEMEIDTIRIHNALSSEGGTLKIVYRLTMQGQTTYNDTDIIIE